MTILFNSPLIFVESTILINWLFKLYKRKLFKQNKDKVTNQLKGFINKFNKLFINLHHINKKIPDKKYNKIIVISSFLSINLTKIKYHKRSLIWKIDKHH